MNGYPCTKVIQPRYNDFDMQGHLNNAVYLTYFELARIDYFNLIHWDLKTITNVVAKFTIDFLLPVLPGDPVVVHIRVAKLGRTSFTMQYKLTNAEYKKEYCTASSVQVCIDRLTHTPVAIPEDIKKNITLIDAEI